MTVLLRPDPAYAASWIASVFDFGDAAQMAGSGHWNVARVVPTEQGCREFVAAQMAAEQGSPDGRRVPSTYFWIADGSEVVGFLNLRHRLNPELLEVGGHVGYSIRPSRRRQGHARRALRLALRYAVLKGIDRVLVTCDEQNEGSRRAVVANGGVREDVRAGKERYWIAVG